jgi:hypothetical protein
MSIKEKQDKTVTDSTRFLLRGVGLLKPELAQYGFINAYIDDVDHEPHYKDCLYLLFKPVDIQALEFFIEEQREERTPRLVEEYDHPGGYVVIVYKFPAKYMEDYRLFLEGKYSKFSDDYKGLFPMERTGMTKKNIPTKEPSFYDLIFNRRDEMRNVLEEKLDVILDPGSEYWSSPTLSHETINIKNYDERY